MRQTINEVKKFSVGAEISALGGDRSKMNFPQILIVKRYCESWKALSLETLLCAFSESQKFISCFGFYEHKQGIKLLSDENNRRVSYSIR